MSKSELLAPSLDRRSLLSSGLLAAGNAVLSGCSPGHQNKETAQAIETMKRELKRLTQAMPEDSATFKAVNGRLDRLSPIFAPVINVGIADPRTTYARLHFGNVQQSQQDRFVYYLNKDRSTSAYKTILAMTVTLFLSPVWLASKKDEVKTLVLEKEAATLALYETWSKFAYYLHRESGRIDKLSPGVPDEEIARSLGVKTLLENPHLLKAYDYAGHLAVMPKVERLLEAADREILQELDYTPLAIIYQKAKTLGIDFAGANSSQAALFLAAVDLRSPWYNMVTTDPTIPGPTLRLQKTG